VECEPFGVQRQSPSVRLCGPFSDVRRDRGSVGPHGLHSGVNDRLLCLLWGRRLWERPESFLRLVEQLLRLDDVGHGVPHGRGGGCCLSAGHVYLSGVTKKATDPCWSAAVWRSVGRHCGEFFISSVRAALRCLSRSLTGSGLRW
jgi:hypothetical protein